MSFTDETRPLLGEDRDDEPDLAYLLPTDDILLQQQCEELRLHASTSAAAEESWLGHVPTAVVRERAAHRSVEAEVEMEEAHESENENDIENVRRPVIFMKPRKRTFLAVTYIIFVLVALGALFLFEFHTMRNGLDSEKSDAKKEWTETNYNDQGENVKEKAQKKARRHAVNLQDDDRR